MTPTRRVLPRYLLLVSLAALVAAQIAAGVLTVARLPASATPGGISGPRGLIWDLEAVREAGGYPVAGVAPGSSARRAGLRAGDLVVSVDGVSLSERPEIYFRSVIGGEAGADLDLTWLRDGRELSGTVALESRRRPREAIEILDSAPSGTLAARAEVQVGVFSRARHGLRLLPPLLMLVVGAGIGFVRIRDRIAFTVALLLLVLAQSLSMVAEFTPTLVIWPPWAVTVSLVLSRLAIYPLALLIVEVLAVFPNPSPFGRWLIKRRWLLLPYAALSIESVIELIRRVHGTRILPSALVAALDRALPWHIMWLALLLLATALVLAQRGGAGQSRAKLRIVEAGLIGTLLGGFWVLFLWNSEGFWQIVRSPQGAVLRAVLSGAASVVPVLLLCSFPLALGYAVFSRRVFGIRLIVRRSIRYLLLSKGVLVVEGVLLFLVLGEAIRQSQRAVSASVPAVAGIAGTVSLIVVLGLVRVNRPIMRWVDRLFFRESYDARRLLLDLSQQLLTLREREDVLSHAGGVLLNTLHPARVAFHLGESDGGAARLAWSASLEQRGGGVPVGTPPRAGSAADADVVSEGMSAFDQGGAWWAAPEGDSGDGGPAEESSVDLLVALRGSTGVLGCIALGPKLSEEPYGGEDRALLVTVATQMGFALENADLLEVATREAEHSRELSIARRVQRDLFPKELPAPAGWEFAALCRPARAVGGDYYDLFTPDPGHVVIAVGDVSGKGLGPSLVMSAVHAVVRSRLRDASIDLSSVARELNEHLLTSSSSEMFMTLFVGILEVGTGRLRYVNAGHNPPVLVGDGATRLETGGVPVGMLPGAPYQEGEAALAPGDTLVVYSDGVTEAMNKGGEMYEDERLLREIDGARGEPADEVLDLVVHSVERFAGGAEQADDLTLLVARRRAAASS